MNICVQTNLAADPLARRKSLKSVWHPIQLEPAHNGKISMRSSERAIGSPLDIH